MIRVRNAALIAVVISPYTSGVYQQRLRELGLTASMSRQGNCFDNAVAES